MASQSAPAGIVTRSYSGDSASYQTSTGGSTVVFHLGGGARARARPKRSSGALVAETTGYSTSAAATEYLDLDESTLVSDTVQDSNTFVSTNTYSASGPMAAAGVTLSTDAMGKRHHVVPQPTRFLNLVPGGWRPTE